MTHPVREYDTSYMVTRQAIDLSGGAVLRQERHALILSLMDHPTKDIPGEPIVIEYLEPYPDRPKLEGLMVNIRATMLAIPVER